MKKQLQKAGFTLIELIVVIAILGVLAGGAAVGYSGYVKKANKAADQQLVGSIERALDVGSYAFDIDNVLQLGGEGLKLPVGFVVLKADGNAEAMESGSTEKRTEGNECVVVPYSQLKSALVEKGITIDYVISDVEGIVPYGEQVTTNCVTDGYGTIVTKDVSSLPLPSGSVCITHSDFTKLYCDDEWASTVYLVSVDEFEKAAQNPDSNIDAAARNGTKLRGISVAEDTEDLDYFTGTLVDTTKHPEHKNGAKPNSFSTFDPGMVTAQSDGELYNAMVAAFGDSWRSELTLKYNGWTASELNNDMPSIYVGGADTFEKIQTMIENVLQESNLNLTQNQIANEFGNTMNFIVTQIDRDELYAAWEKINNSQVGAKVETDFKKQYGNATEVYVWQAKFGENYRDALSYAPSLDDAKAFSDTTALMYNAGFTSWMLQQSNGGHNDATTAQNHANAILEWGDKTGNAGGGSANDPLTICRGAFKDSASNLPAEIKSCESCFNCYEKYVSTGAWKANADAAYQTFKTVADTSGAVENYAEEGKINYFDYYKNYMAEFKNMFGKVQEMANNTDGSCIIIAVYRTGSGAMDYDVYPAAADPRKS